MLPLFDLTAIWLIVVNALAWPSIQIGMGYLSHRMSLETLAWFSRLLRTRRWEQDGTIYQHLFLVKRWKSLLPSGGTVFPGGFSLKQVASSDPAYLHRWVMESYRAEIAHWTALFPVVLFLLWNPPLGWAINVFYALVVNVPCIIVQRYNRPRLLAIVQKKSEQTPERDIFPVLSEGSAK